MQAALRKMVIELILATDMQKHVAVHTALQTRLAVMQVHGCKLVHPPVLTVL